MAIIITCPKCRRQGKLVNSFWKKEYRCRRCQESFDICGDIIERFERSAKEPPVEYITCKGCHKTVLLIGGDCPLCGQHERATGEHPPSETVSTIQSPQTQAATDPQEVSTDGPLDDGLPDLEAMAESEFVAKPAIGIRAPSYSSKLKTCSSCRASIPIDAVLCTSCGFDYRKQKKRHTMLVRPKRGDEDVHGRTRVPQGLEAPRYRGIRFIAYCIMASGILQVMLGLFVICASLYVGTAAGRLTNEEARKNAADRKESQRELDAIAQLEQDVEESSADDEELLSDKLVTLQQKHEQNEQRRRRRSAERKIEFEAKRAVARGAKSIAGLGRIQGLGIVFAGIITIGISQIFSAFRDMAINSYLIAHV